MNVAVISNQPVETVRDVIAFIIDSSIEHVDNEGYHAIKITKTFALWSGLRVTCEKPHNLIINPYKSVL